jgi:hypothetical protein
MIMDCAVGGVERGRGVLQYARKKLSARRFYISPSIPSSGFLDTLRNVAKLITQSEVRNALDRRRWKINDGAAATFAESFYRKLLTEEQPLGLVIRDARIGCKARMPEDDFSWASYIYYGDPRLYFRKLV